MSEEYNEDIDSTNDEQEVDTVETQPKDEDETEQDDNDSLSDREKQFLARAKKAEAKLKERKQPQETNKTNKPTDQSDLSDQVQREVFLATGGTTEELEVLDSIVGGSIAEKKQNPLYKAYKAQQEVTKQDEQASLGTSKGGKKTVDKPKSREERKAEYEKRLKELNG